MVVFCVGTHQSQRHTKKWEKALHGCGDFKMTMATKLCSNHFTAGDCSDICRVPTLYLRGSASTLSLSPWKRKLGLSNVSARPKKRSRNY